MVLRVSVSPWLRVSTSPHRRREHPANHQPTGQGPDPRPRSRGVQVLAEAIDARQLGQVSADARDHQVWVAVRGDLPQRYGQAGQTQHRGQQTGQKHGAQPRPPFTD